MRNPITTFRPCECGCGIKVRARFKSGHRPRYSIEDRGYRTPCWIWSGCINKSGYGILSVNGRTTLAHVKMFTDARGSVPEGRELDHLCRIRACANPAHLEAVDHPTNVRRGAGTKLSAENISEMTLRYQRGEIQSSLAKGFSVSQAHVSRILLGRTWSGVAQGVKTRIGCKAKLSPLQVREILLRSRKESRGSIAKVYSVSTGAIGHIVRGENWARISK